jgi:4-carboxymuconolactone decarboxylase
MNIVMLIALNRGPELRIHLRAALHNGLSEEQLCEACRHAMVYCGVPAGRDALVIASEVLEERKQTRNVSGPKLS